MWVEQLPFPLRDTCTGLWETIIVANARPTLWNKSSSSEANVGRVEDSGKQLYTGMMMKSVTISSGDMLVECFGSISTSLLCILFTGPAPTSCIPHTVVWTLCRATTTSLCVRGFA